MDPCALPHTQGRMVEVYMEFEAPFAVLDLNMNIDVQFSGSQNMSEKRMKQFPDPNWSLTPEL